MALDEAPLWMLGLRYIGMLCRDSHLERIRPGLQDSTWELVTAASASELLSTWSDLDGVVATASEAAELSRYLRRGAKVAPAMRELLARSLERPR